MATKLAAKISILANAVYQDNFVKNVFWQSFSSLNAAYFDSNNFSVGRTGMVRLSL